MRVNEDFAEIHYTSRIKKLATRANNPAMRTALEIEKYPEYDGNNYPGIDFVKTSRGWKESEHQDQ